MAYNNLVHVTQFFNCFSKSAPSNVRQSGAIFWIVSPSSLHWCQILGASASRLRRQPTKLLTSFALGNIKRLSASRIPRSHLRRTVHIFFEAVVRPLAGAHGALAHATTWIIPNVIYCWNAPKRNRLTLQRINQIWPQTDGVV